MIGVLRLRPSIRNEWTGCAQDDSSSFSQLSQVLPFENELRSQFSPVPGKQKGGADQHQAAAQPDPNPDRAPS